MNTNSNFNPRCEIQTVAISARKHITLLLFCAEFHVREMDERSQKREFIVRQIVATVDIEALKRIPREII